MSDLAGTLSLFWPSLVASVVVALACALVGVHVVARRLVVTGVALPQAAAAGIAVSFVCHDWPVLGNHDAAALLAVAAGVAILAFGARRARLGQDALAGLLFAGSAAGTILVVQRSAGGIDEIRHLVEGNVLAIHAPDLWVVVPVLGSVAVLHAAGLQRFLLVTFDRETAATLGVRTGLWDALLFASLAVVAAWGVHATGTLFVFGFLLLPGVTGIALGRSPAAVFAVSAALAATASAGGFLLSCAWDTPTGPTCVAAALALTAASLTAGAVPRFRASALPRFRRPPDRGPAPDTRQ